MKYPFLILISLFTAQFAQAGLSLTCDAWKGEDQKSPASIMMAIIGIANLNCHDSSGNQFGIIFDGLGGGAELTVADHVWVNCPFVREKRIMNGEDLVVVGPRVSVEVVVGPQVGFALNFRAAACFFGGVAIGGGGSAQVGRMTIAFQSKQQDEF